jgi:hypothetical protein
VKEATQKYETQQVPFEQIPHWLLDKATSNEIYLYLTVRRYAMGKKECWPSRETLAGDMDLSAKTIQRLLKKLVEYGALEIEPRYTDSGRQTSNVYRIMWDEPKTGQESPPPLDTSDHDEGVSHDQVPGSPMSHEDIPIRSKQTKTIGQGVTALADKQFDEFWEIYPRKVGKPQAQKAFKKALEEISLEEILRCTKEYQQQRRGEDLKFTKHPATFLNSKPWLDEPAKVYDPDWWLNNPRTTPFDNGIED